MPIYEYQCGACGAVSEVMQRMSDAPLAHCPTCEKGPMTKLISRTSFQLKGTGWYATDYKKSTATTTTAAKPAAEATVTEPKAPVASEKKQTGGSEK